MNIVVCIKQVPDVDDIKWTKENNLDRQGMLSKLNSADEWALNWAMNLKSKFKEASVTAISMGPNQALDVLEYALAKGAERAILLSDKSFSGSDTLITAKILSLGIEKYIPDYNLIITGQKADDGDTEQVPVSLAQYLNIPDVTHTVEIHNADKNSALVSQNIDSEVNMYEMTTPCLVAVKKECPKIVTPRINDYIRAESTAIEVYGANDLGLTQEQTGIIGSPTVVYRAFRPQIEKNTVEIKENYARNILDMIFKV